MTESVTVQIREAVLAEIEASKTATDFVRNDFEVAESYLPQTDLKDLPAAGKVWVVAMAKDDTIGTRGKMFQSEIPIQIALQQNVEDDDLTTINELVRIHGQLRKACIRTFSSLTILNPDNGSVITPAWLRNEAMRDGTGMPLMFMGLREHSVFEAYFTAFFQVHDQ